MEVIIADGMSTDQTRAEILSWLDGNPDLVVRIIDNTKRAIPSGVNRAIEAAEGEFLIRLDAHSIPRRDYIERSVIALKNGKGDNVGGIWQIMPGGSGGVSRAIAAASAHPLGVGGAQYRVGGKPQIVDTVPFGAFRRDLVNRIGLFNEDLLSNEDYEYNARIRDAGGIVWFDPEIQSTYIARSSYRELAHQYWRYGYWKVQMLRVFPHTIRWRQALPPLFVFSFLCFGLFSLYFGWARALLVLELSIYGLALLFVGLQMAREHADWKMLLGVPLAIGVMHFSWGLAFLWSLVKTIFSRTER
jgi:cellulose synthase/poly-beta-1,6-N-acetylglucosamine synthase-like glycosyltransferase